MTTSDMEGYVFNIQPMSVHDGPGLRTTVFLAGCPLRCSWCANPEGLDFQAPLSFNDALCIDCKDCVKLCGFDPRIERMKGTQFPVQEVCPTGALKPMIRRMHVDEVIEEVLRYQSFYTSSGGGVTFSGGEATLQTDFFNTLVRRLYDMCIHLALETSAFFDFDSLRDSLDKMDTLYVDIKLMDEEAHKKWTGVSNVPILENISRLKDFRGELILRIPVIEGINDDEDNLTQTLNFMKEHVPQAALELLPYHNFGTAKSQAMGLPFQEFRTPSKEKLAELKHRIRQSGIQLINER